MRFRCPGHRSFHHFPSSHLSFLIGNGVSFWQLAAALICRAGFYRPAEQFIISNFSSPCLPCAKGTAKSLNEWHSSGCIECQAGFYTNSTASPECRPCPVGSKQPLRGQASCTACEVGKYRDVFSLDARECIFCNASMYMPLRGAAACFRCPNNSATGEFVLHARDSAMILSKHRFRRRCFATLAMPAASSKLCIM